MRVVLDTNVVVSAFLVPLGKPAAILRLALRHDFDTCFDTAILAEYEEVLTRSKFVGRIYQADIQRFFEIMCDIGENIISTLSFVSMPDETDRKFYDVARTANAYLITGNKKHYPDEPFVVTPDQFLSNIMRQ